MQDLRRKVLEIVEGVSNKELMVTLIIQTVASGLGRLRRSPRNGTVHNGLTHVESDGWPSGTNPMPTGTPPVICSPDLGSDLSPDPESPDLSKPLISEGESDGPEPPGFLEFWALYPKKVGKTDARRVWRRRRPPIGKVRAALAWQVRCRQWLAGYVPNPSTYINQGRWEDEPEGTTGLSERELRGAIAGDLFVRMGKK